MERAVRIVLITVTLAACGGDPKTPAERFVGDWHSAFLDLTIGFTGKSGGAYEAHIFRMTSGTTANDQLETGVFVASDTQFVATPKQWTCPGPDPIVAISYHFEGNNLVQDRPSGGQTFVPGPAPAASLAVTLGCMKPDGSFVKAPLAPVSNQ
jgi:hypothetical protein